MSIASAIATLRAQGAKVGTVFYDHDPKGGQWHYSINLRDCTPHNGVGSCVMGPGQFYRNAYGDTIVRHAEENVRGVHRDVLPPAQRRAVIKQRAVQVENLLWEIAARIEALKEISR